MRAHQRISNHSTWISDKLIGHRTGIDSDVLVPVARLAHKNQREMESNVLVAIARLAFADQRETGRFL